MSAITVDFGGRPIVVHLGENTDLALKAAQQAKALVGGAQRSGTFADRDAIPIEERVRGLRFLVTEDASGPFQEWREYEWRLAGDRDGPTREWAFLTAPQWCALYTEREKQHLDIVSFQGTLPAANVEQMPTALANIGELYQPRIYGFRAVALSTTSPLRAMLEWDGEADGFTLSWGNFSLPIGGGIRAIDTQAFDYEAVRPLLFTGDSMLDGTWVASAAADSGRDAVVVAKYSSGAKQVYRLGVRKLLCTAAGNAIPASGGSVAVTSINGVAPSTSAVGDNPSSFDLFAAHGFLNTSSGDTISTHCSEAGTWGGRHGVMSVPNGGTPIYTFTPDDGLGASTVPAQSPFVPDNLARLKTHEVTARLSQNYAFAGPGNPVFPNDINPRVLEDLQLIAAETVGQPFTVLGLSPQNNFTTGTPFYTALRYLNGTQANGYADGQFYQLFGSRYAIVTVAGVKYNNSDYVRWFGRDGSANDQADYDAGINPRSVMETTTSDEVHYNAKGEGLEKAFWLLWRQQRKRPPAIISTTLFTLVGTRTQPAIYPEEPVLWTSEPVTAGLDVGYDAGLADQLELIKQAQASGAPYYPTRAAGADALTLGDFFTSNETGETRYYEVTATTPFYVDRGRVSEEVTKATVDLANVDNTSDLAKPISDAQRAAIDLATLQQLTGGPKRALKDKAADFVCVDDFKLGTDIDDAPSFNRAIAYVVANGGQGEIQLRKRNYYFTQPTGTFSLPGDIGALTAGAAPYGVTMAAEVPGTMPFAINPPQGIRFVGRSRLGARIIGPWIYGVSTVDNSQVVALKIGASRTDNVVDLGLENIRFENFMVPIVAEGVLVQNRWDRLEFRNCGIPALIQTSERSSFRSIRINETPGGFTIGGWWLNRENSYSDPVLPNAFAHGWADKNDFDIDYSNSRIRSGTDDALDAWFDTNFFKTDNSTTGVGYTTAPTADASAGNGDGATFTVQRDSHTRKITGVVVTTAGSGYTANFPITFTGGGGAGAAATAIVSGGSVIGVAIGRATAPIPTGGAGGLLNANMYRGVTGTAVQIISRSGRPNFSNIVHVRFAFGCHRWAAKVDRPYLCEFPTCYAERTGFYDQANYALGNRVMGVNYADPYWSGRPRAAIFSETTGQFCGVTIFPDPAALEYPLWLGGLTGTNWTTEFVPANFTNLISRNGYARGEYRLMNQGGNTDQSTLDWFFKSRQADGNQILFDANSGLSVEGTTTPGTVTLSARRLIYTRVGNVVHFTLRITFSAYTGAGGALIKGLPFTAASIDQNLIFRSVAGVASANRIMPVVQSGTTQIALRQYDATGAESALNLPASGDFYISGSYFVA